MVTVYTSRPAVRILIDGREVPSSTIIEVHGSHGWSLRTSEATVQLLSIPSWCALGSTIRIECGPLLAQRWPRFCGFIVDYDRSHYPEEIGLVCRGPLHLAEITANHLEDGTDLSNSGSGRTIEWIEGTILDACGLSEADLAAKGWTRYLEPSGGTLYGTIADDKWIWQKDEFGLDRLHAIYRVLLGRRLYEMMGGHIKAATITTIPTAVPVFTLTEGVDIAPGAKCQELTGEVRNRIEVTGYDPGGGVGPAYYAADGYNPYLAKVGVDYLTEPVSSDLIERETTVEAGEGVSCQEVAEWQLGERNRLPVKLTIPTPRGDWFDSDTVIAVEGNEHLHYSSAVDGNCWIQRVDWGFGRTGKWGQVLTAIGGRHSSAPPAGNPQAAFTWWFEQETVVIAGVETTLYLVHCIDCSSPKSGAIASRAWTATGGTPSSGTGSTFTVTYTDLTARSIALEVTDANGLTGSVTRTVPTASQATYLKRPLWLAGGVEFESFDGGSWHTDAPSAGTVDVVANGPLAGAGALALVTDDYLFSSATESTPFDGGATVEAAWMETDVSQSRMALGSSDGRIGLSTDAGASFTIKDGPDANAVLRIILSRDNLLAVYVLTAAGLYLSVDWGDTWTTLVAAAGGETFRDVCVSHTRQMIVMSGGRLACDGSGTAQTFAGTDPTDVVAVTADIVEDRFYAYDSDKNTWYTSADGGTEFGAMTALPAAAVVKARGLQRDGMVRGLLYFAAGTAGCYKSVDGFGSAGGYFKVREPGVGNADANADYAMIGVDGLLVNPFTGITEYSDSDCKVLSLWDTDHNDDPPAGWEQPDYDDSAWSAATEQGDSAEISGAKDIWAATVQSATEECLFRLSYSAGAGARTSCSLDITADDVVVEIYHNGIYLGSKSTAQSTVLTITIDPALVVVGTNVLCVWVRNADA